MSSTIGIIGGTGPQGKGLGFRFALGGHQVILGSRSSERAAAAAVELQEKLPADAQISGATNAEAADQADIVLLAIPYDGHDGQVIALAPHVKDKVLISCVNPLGFDKKGPYGLDMQNSSAAEGAQELAPAARVVGAFHHLSAMTLLSDDSMDHEDVLVVGDDQEAKAAVIELARSVTGKPGIDAGALRLARQLEPLTAVLISINKKYKIRAGVAISGIPEAARK